MEINPDEAFSIIEDKSPKYMYDPPSHSTIQTFLGIRNNVRESFGKKGWKRYKMFNNPSTEE